MIYVPIYIYMYIYVYIYIYDYLIQTCFVIIIGVVLVVADDPYHFIVATLLMLMPLLFLLFKYKQVQCNRYTVESSECSKYNNIWILYVLIIFDVIDSCHYPQ